MGKLMDTVFCLMGDCRQLMIELYFKQWEGNGTIEVAGLLIKISSLKSVKGLTVPHS